MAEQTRGVVEMTAAMTISGTIGWFVLASGLPALDVVFWHCAFAALALTLSCLWTGAFSVSVSCRQMAVVTLGGAAIVLNWLLLFAAYRFASVSIATAVYNVQPFILLGFGVVLFGERITLTKIAWLGFAFGGLLLIVLQRPSADYIGGSFAFGIILVLGAATGWAIAAATTKSLQGVPPQLIALVHVVTGVVILAPFVDFTALPTGVLTWRLLVTIGLLHTAIMYALMYSAVQKLPTHVQGTLALINPVVAVLTDVFALDHALHGLQLMGIGMILVAAAGTTVLPAVLARRRRRGAKCARVT